MAGSAYKDFNEPNIDDTFSDIRSNAYKALNAYMDLDEALKSIRKSIKESAKDSEKYPEQFGKITELTEKVVGNNRLTLPMILDLMTYLSSLGY